MIRRPKHGQGVITARYVSSTFAGIATAVTKKFGVPVSVCNANCFAAGSPVVPSPAMAPCLLPQTKLCLRCFHHQCARIGPTEETSSDQGSCGGSQPCCTCWAANRHRLPGRFSHWVSHLPHSPATAHIRSCFHNNRLHQRRCREQQKHGNLQMERLVWIRFRFQQVMGWHDISEVRHRCRRPGTYSSPWPVWVLPWPAAQLLSPLFLPESASRQVFASPPPEWC